MSRNAMAKGAHKVLISHVLVRLSPDHQRHTLVEHVDLHVLGTEMAKLRSWRMSHCMD